MPGGPEAAAGRPTNPATFVLMSKTFKTEAVVLRSIRYGEADRILHLYSREYGRLGAIAKGSRKPKTRFGGRLEPFFRLALVLHRGRGDLHTVTSAETVEGYPDLRSSGSGIRAASDACGAVLRLLDGAEPNLPAYNLLCRYLALVDEDPAGPAAGPGGMVTFRLKLALAAGFAPELSGCSRCGNSEHLTAFSGVAGGVVCPTCEANSFPLSDEAHDFMVGALGRPMSEAPHAGGSAVRQAGRAIGETLEHHAHVRLPRPEEKSAA